MPHHLALFTALVLVLPALARPNKSRRNSNKYHRLWRARRRDCEKLCYEPDGVLPRDEAQNCANRCTSHACFEEVYGADPLEDGEVDSARSRGYTACLTREQRTFATEERRTRNARAAAVADGGSADAVPPFEGPPAPEDALAPWERRTRDSEWLTERARRAAATTAENKNTQQKANRP